MGGKDRTFAEKRRKEYEDYSDMLFDMSFSHICDLNCTAYITKEPVSFDERFSGKEMIVRQNTKWAEEVFDCAWFHVTGELPSGYDKSKLVFMLNCGGEGLIYDLDGNEIQSVTCFAAGFGAGLGTPVKRIVPIYDELHFGNKVDFWMDCGANDLFGDMENESRVGELAIGQVNSEIRALAYDIQVLLSVYDYGSDKDFNTEIKSAIEKIIAFGEVNESSAKEMREILKPLLERENTDEHAFTYSAIGHAHLDLAWLWPIRESKRKGARTFSTQIKNIALYPEYKFGASQAQLYQWMKDSYPRIYEKVKALAKTPNWDVQGATWVEPDSNLIGGESMVRQFYYGKKFFKEEFGKDMQIFWVPDSFGYSGCLPQVMKLAGVKYFLTQKISWNIYNKFPYHTFYWQGIDGSEILAHMLPEDTYNAPVRGDVLTAGEKNYAERSISDISMSLFGIGDGGAGPGYEHLERARRFKNLYSMPKVQYEKSDDFFRKLDDKAVPYPTHKGELYLERHQGTYTTRAKNKRYNRKCEIALGNYEKLIALALDKEIALPLSQNKIDEIWKEILLYQFHDILPGSSINRVYEESEKRYEIILQTLNESISYLLKQLIHQRAAVNFNPFSYATVLKVDGEWYNAPLPAFGYCSVASMGKITDGFKSSCGDDYIENDKVKVTFKDGVITSLFNKSLGREFAVPDNPMAQVSQYDDNGDCWDIENCRADYLSTKQNATCTGFEIYQDGAKAVTKGEYTVGGCKIVQTFYILDGDAAVYVDLALDVKQESKMLRIAFPTNMKADICNYNVQFGHIGRKTTENDSVETAQFETSGQKFVDLSEKEYGLSLINDCKYGFRCKHGVMDMNLVRSPKGGPGINVDQGHHVIKYALFTHDGKLSEETYKAAYLLNNPPIITDGENDVKASSGLLKTDNENVVVETVKPADNKDGIIVRLYNSSSTEQTANVEIKGYIPNEVVDITENSLSEKTDGSVKLHPFELINIRFVKSM